ncbi:MAG TPA: DUF3592 domain-containing protein [Bryobacteraceae bacterium]|nr:DUF3592 domain-containing protein [Bryobacteraceae bacterium]
MGTAIQPRKAGKAWGLAILLGYFFVFCATAFFLAAVWRGYRSHVVDTRWVEVLARIRTCSLDEYHPFAREGGGVVYSLHCRLQYETSSHPYETDLRTISDRSPVMRERIREWAARSRPGTFLRTRVNPADPKELVVEDALPIRQFPTARDAWVTMLIFGMPGLLLIAIGRKFRR